MPPPLRDLLAAANAELAPLERAANQAWWDASTDVSEEHEAERIRADLELRAALADRDRFAAVSTAPGDAADAAAERQRAVLGDLMLPHQVPDALRDRIVRLEASIDATFNSHRGVLDGAPVDDNTIAGILRGDDDPTRRRRAWEAAKTVGAAVAPRVRELAHLRNEAARALGHRDHFALTLATSELDEHDLFALLDAVDEATRKPFGAWKERDDASRAVRFGVAVADLRPWHYDDPFFQEAPREPDLDLDAWFAGLDLVALTARTYASIGLDVSALVAASDLAPRAGKSQHAFCINIDRASDIRVLCNNVAGARWAETMLHEFGHAVYDDGVDRALPWLLRTMHPLTTEGVAMLFGRLTTDPAWLASVVGVEAATLASVAPGLARIRLLAQLVFARWVLVMTNFERGLYADPDADHDTRWWDLVERYQLLRRPDGRRAPDWAAKLHLALAPVYYQNYLLGELVASQLEATVRERFGSVVGSAAIGEFLTREVFGPGWSVPWHELIERATGAPLGVTAYAAELTSLEAAAAS